MEKKLNSETQQLVLNNQKLVYYILQKFGIYSNYSDYEDLVSIGTIGLIKASITFDASKSFTFSTYATRCIENEIIKNYKRNSKYASNISIDELKSYDKDNNQALIDMIEDSKSDFVKEIIIKEEYINLVNIILNVLQGKERIVYLYLMSNIKQQKIADKLNISRRQVSDIKGKVSKKLKNIANKSICHNNTIYMTIVGYEYRIYISAPNIKDFNKKSAIILKNLTISKEIFDIKVKWNKERIIIQTCANPKVFYYIAECFLEIYNLNKTAVSKNYIVPADDRCKVEAYS